jgi:hypothetical protein
MKWSLKKCLILSAMFNQVFVLMLGSSSKPFLQLQMNHSMRSSSYQRWKTLLILKLLWADLGHWYLFFCQIRHICPPPDALLKLVMFGDSLSETSCTKSWTFVYISSVTSTFVPWNFLVPHDMVTRHGINLWAPTCAPTKKSCEHHDKPTCIWGICRQKTKRTDFRWKMVSTLFVHFQGRPSNPWS